MSLTRVKRQVSTGLVGTRRPTSGSFVTRNRGKWTEKSTPTAQERRNDPSKSGRPSEQRLRIRLCHFGVLLRPMPSARFLLDLRRVVFAADVRYVDLCRRQLQPHVVHRAGDDLRYREIAEPFVV